jgi:hypothetical protein
MLLILLFIIFKKIKEFTTENAKNNNEKNIFLDNPSSVNIRMSCPNKPLLIKPCE